MVYETNKSNPDYKFDDEDFVHLFRRVAYGSVMAANEHLMKTKCWNSSSLILAEAAKAHGRCFVISQFFAFIQDYQISSGLKLVLSSLFKLLAITWILENSSNFIRYAGLDFAMLDQLLLKRNRLLSEIRPISVSLVDSFDFRDEVLGSTLGCWDGWVYHRLYQAAVKSPLNQEKNHHKDNFISKL